MIWLVACDDCPSHWSGVLVTTLMAEEYSAQSTSSIAYRAIECIWLMVDLQRALGSCCCSMSSPVFSCSCPQRFCSQDGKASACWLLKSWAPSSQSCTTHIVDLQVCLKKLFSVLALATGTALALTQLAKQQCTFFARSQRAWPQLKWHGSPQKATLTRNQHPEMTKM